MRNNASTGWVHTYTTQTHTHTTSLFGTGYDPSAVPLTMRETIEVSTSDIKRRNMSNFHLQLSPATPVPPSIVGTDVTLVLPQAVPAKSSFLNLERIRHELVQMEDTIVFAQNLSIYAENHENFVFDSSLSSNESFLDYLLREMESVHAKVRRYTSPDEYPFSSDLPKPILPPLKFPQLLYPNSINLNSKLKDIYIKNIIPALCKDGDDKNYGSSATKDIDALQMLSRRIHFGKFVAEAKFQDPSTREEYVRLIKLKDRAGINALLTNLSVEERLLKRLRLKALIFGQEINEGLTGTDLAGAMNEETWRNSGDGKKRVRKIDPELVVKIYEQYVIPLTKEVEVDYLIGRLDFPDFVPEV
ncbi:chorismate mutase aro7 [Entophlyctis sp. JEL0112]|nr:chorismate mutase aro7 [Entophlyctis sp. JEL0112]